MSGIRQLAGPVCRRRIATGKIMKNTLEFLKRGKNMLQNGIHETGLTVKGLRVQTYQKAVWYQRVSLTKSLCSAF